MANRIGIETPEDCDYNNEDDVNSPNILSCKNILIYILPIILLISVPLNFSIMLELAGLYPMSFRTSRPQPIKKKSFILTGADMWTHPKSALLIFPAQTYAYDVKFKIFNQLALYR